MKISKYLRVEKSTGFNKFKRAQIRMQNKCKGHLYLVYTSYNGHWLFEIIESRYLTDQHKNCYLVAVASSKETAAKYVGFFINELYNLQTISYDMLKT